MEKRQCCRCVHGIEADFNSINELIIYCELTGGVDECDPRKLPWQL